ncbi:tetratricopeptide repeat protein [Bacteroidota bacterium]
MRTLLLLITLLATCPSFGQDNPDNYLIARSYMLQGRYDAAIDLLRAHTEVQPTDYNTRYNLGLCYYNTKKYNKALEEFLIVNRLQRSMASYMLAKTETALNHPEIAVKYLKEHLRTSNRLSEKDILLDEDLTELQESEAWKMLWKEREWYNTSDKQLQEAIYLKSTNKIPEAINLFNDLIKRGVKHRESYYHLAEIYLNAGNKKAASQAIDNAIKADPRNIEALKLRISLAMEEEDYESSSQDCFSLLRRAPDEFSYYLISAEVVNAAGNFEKALEYAKIYTSVFPDSAAGYNVLGKVNYLNRKYLDALVSLNRALELDIAKPEYYYNRGRTYAATKTHKYAERDFSMALDLDPSNADIWFEKGKTDLALGFTEKACFDFKKALQYGKYEASDYIRANCNNQQ